MSSLSIASDGLLAGNSLAIASRGYLGAALAFQEQPPIGGTGGWVDRQRKRKRELERLEIAVRDAIAGFEGQTTTEETAEKERPKGADVDTGAALASFRSLENDIARLRAQAEAEIAAIQGRKEAEAQAAYVKVLQEQERRIQQAYIARKRKQNNDALTALLLAA